MKNFLQSLGLQKQPVTIVDNSQWMALLGLIFGAWIAVRLVRLIASIAIKRVVSNNHIPGLTKKLERTVTFPIGMMTFALVMSTFFPLLKLPPELTEIAYRLFKITGTVGFILLGYFLIDLISLFFDKWTKETENKFDDILLPLLRKTAKTFVVAIGVIMIGDSLTFDMKSILTGLGIGGLAFALAAKDTLANLFGSLTVILDRPFRIGDWVKIGSDVEGTVEQVGLRSTRVRTFSDSLITLPNGSLTNVSIDNFGLRNYRRFLTTLGITYDTPPEKIEAFCEGIRQLIVSSPNIKKDDFHVYLNNMGDFSLQIMVRIFWLVPDFATELAARHRFLIDIMRLAQSLKVEFAFPTSSVHLYNQPNTEHQSLDSDYFEKGAQAAEKISAKPISFLSARSKADEQGKLPVKY
jgi:MscS family membrane protein